MGVADTTDHQLPEPGTLFAGRYRIERLLGVGGMGSVLLARHEVIGQHVALKLLHPEAASSPAAVERFVKEARAASKIEGQHVVHIYDVGTDDGTPKGRPYLCMEYLRGKDLGQVFDTQGPLPAYEVCSALLDASIALAQAHSVGIVHRDLKPSNLFYAEQPAGKAVLKVLDFGIAKMDDGLGSVHATSTGMIMGTPSYMAPEQMRSSKMVDARADIWALGVIAYELLTGRLPYQGDSLGDILFAVVEKPPPWPHQLRPELGAELSGVVMKCLQRDPDKRFATVTELSDALEPFATASRVGTAAALRLSISGERLTSPAFDLENAKTEQLTASPKTVSEWVTESHLGPKRNLRLLGGVAALLLLGGVALGVTHALSGGAVRNESTGTGARPAASQATPAQESSATAEPAVTVPSAPAVPAVPQAAITATKAAADPAADAAAPPVVSSGPTRRTPLRPAGDTHRASTTVPAAAPVVAAPAPAPTPAPAPPLPDKSGLTHSKGWDGVQP
jgi:serine/threonine-protein kinase